MRLLRTSLTLALLRITPVAAFRMASVDSSNDTRKRTIASVVGTSSESLGSAADDARGDWSLMQGMHWRRAVKGFQSGAVVDVSKILEAISLAPSSSGVTPYRVHVVTDQALKLRLRAASYDQAQVATPNVPNDALLTLLTQVSDSFAVLYFSALTDARFVTERYIAARDLDSSSPSYAKMVRGLTKMSKEEFLGWARAQAYIGLGVALAMAAEQKIASCPMEGFVGAEVGALLGLGEDEAVVCCMAVGAEHPEPLVANPHPKHRLPADQVIFHK